MFYPPPPKRGTGGNALLGRFSIAALLLVLTAQSALAHAVTLGDKGYIQEVTGVNIIPFLYLGVALPLNLAHGALCGVCCP